MAHRQLYCVTPRTAHALHAPHHRTRHTRTPAHRIAFARLPSPLPIAHTSPALPRTATYRPTQLPLLHHASLPTCLLYLFRHPTSPVQLRADLPSVLPGMVYASCLDIPVIRLLWLSRYRRQYRRSSVDLCAAPTRLYRRRGHDIVVVSGFMLPRAAACRYSAFHLPSTPFTTTRHGLFTTHATFSYRACRPATAQILAATPSLYATPVHYSYLVAAPLYLVYAYAADTDVSWR